MGRFFSEYVRRRQAEQRYSTRRQRKFGIFKETWWCRWCGKKYKPKKEIERDGFCPGGKCKQAHHRALHKWLNKERSRR